MKLSKAIPVNITMKATSVYKTSRLLAESVELTIVDGVVTAVKLLTRAPDVPAVAVGHASSSLWQNMRDNTSEEINDEPTI